MKATGEPLGTLVDFAATGFREAVSTPRMCLAVRGYCGVLALRALPTFEDMREADAAQQAMLAQYDGRLAWMNAFSWSGNAELDRRIVSIGNGMFKRPGRRATALVNCFLGTSFADTTTRTIIRMAMLAARPEYPHRTCADLTEASTWLAGHFADGPLRAIDGALVETVARSALRTPRPRPSHAG